MAKRIWFKHDCVKWILEGKKTTTFRVKKHVGFYEIDFGSRYKPKPSGIVLRLTPILNCFSIDAIWYHFGTEGDFLSIRQFQEWLKQNKLVLPEIGWLHKIEVMKCSKS